MVGPRGGSPYIKRGNGRISKQQHYQQSIAAQHAQAAAAAASFQHQHQHQQLQQHQHPPQHQQQDEMVAAAIANANSNSGGKFGDDVDEAGGMGDEMDLMSLRDAAMMRYVRYHEWMELVIGTAVETSKYVAGPATTTAIENEAQSAYLNPIIENEQRMNATEQDNKPKGLSGGLSEKALFFKKATEALREEFGNAKDTSNSENSTENELLEKFGLKVTDKLKVKIIRSSMGTPEISNGPSTEDASTESAPSSADQADVDMKNTNEDIQQNMQDTLIDDDFKPDTSMEDFVDSRLAENPINTSTMITENAGENIGDGTINGINNEPSSYTMDSNDAFDSSSLLRDDPTNNPGLDPDAFITLNPDGDDTVSNSALNLLDIPSASNLSGLE